MKRDLTKDPIAVSLLCFAGPMIAGNLLQQAYNLADTFIVGRYIGEDALAAVGGTYTLTTFLYSVLIGLSMGCGALVSFCVGKKDEERIRAYSETAFWCIGLAAVLVEALTLIFSRPILRLLRIPEDILELTAGYMEIILAGVIFVFLYNFYAYLLRGMGNSFTPLVFLGIASALNVVLDIWFVVGLEMGVRGAAFATLIAQVFSGLGLAVYALCQYPCIRLGKPGWSRISKTAPEIFRQSGTSAVQQSVMNFGILMIQGLVNTFGTTVMAAFTVAVKIDTIAYMPAQEFGNAYSLFISQNFGAGKKDRIKAGSKCAFALSALFCLMISGAVFVLARPLMELFVGKGKEAVVQEGMLYLHVEGAFYIGIGILFLLYGYYRGIHKPGVSLVLTVISLGTRVLLAYLLSPIPAFGTLGIWAAIPIGWFLADMAGGIRLLRDMRRS